MLRLSLGEAVCVRVMEVERGKRQASGATSLGAEFDRILFVNEN